MGRGGGRLVEAAVGIDPFEGWVQGQTFAYVALHQDFVNRPLLRRLRVPKPVGKGVDEDETGHAFGIGPRIESGDQAAIGMPDKHVGTGLISLIQQGVQIGDPHPPPWSAAGRIAAARLTDRRSRTVVSTDPGEPGDLGKHRRRGFLGDAPILGGSLEASHHHYNRGPRAATLGIHLAAAADIDEAGRVSAWCGLSGRSCG
jgi:hypothetical protein